VCFVAFSVCVCVFTLVLESAIQVKDDVIKGERERAYVWLRVSLSVYLSVCVLVGLFTLVLESAIKAKDDVIKGECVCV
jgi:hypothetical protein